MLLQCKDLQKHIGAETILARVSFILEEREKAALIGVNGAGKTSVFRLLTGEWKPDGGEMTLAAGTVVGYLPQLTGTGADDTPPAHTLYDELDSVFDFLKRMEGDMRGLEKDMGALSGDALADALKRYEELTARYEAAKGYEAASRVRGVLKGLGFAESEWPQPLYQLSGGQRTRAALGKLLLSEPGLLLLDEPTNHLDIDSVAWLEEYLRGFNGAVLLVSHDRYFMDRVTTKTIEIEHKAAAVYNGPYSFFARQKAFDRETAQKRFADQQKVLKHHEAVIKTLRSYKTEAAIIRAKSREKLLDKIERADAPDKPPAQIKLRLTPKLSSGTDVLTVADVSMGFDGKPLFARCSFEVKKGDRVALIGPNGIGKTTLLKIIMGEYAPLTGRVREGVNVRVGYYDQAQQRLGEDNTLFGELADAYPRLTQTEIRKVLAAFTFTGDEVFKPIAALSGGERGRVALAKIMLAGANFLVLDEPTNHLDLLSKEMLEDALRHFDGAALYISHDRYFINHTATKVLEMSPGGLTEYLGDYDYYLEKKSAAPPSAPAAGKQGAGGDWRKRKDDGAQARRQQGRRDRLETDIAGAEARLAEIDEGLRDEAIAHEAAAVGALYQEKVSLEEILLQLYEAWEEAAG